MPQSLTGLEHLKLKIKLRNALDFDIANYIVQETQKKTEENLDNVFGGV